MFILALAITTIASAASTYHCQTTFGENVPIRKFLLKERCEACESPGAPVPEKFLREKKIELNAAAELLQNQTSKGKRRTFSENGNYVLLDTRYLSQAGNAFKFNLHCPQEGKCIPTFVEGEKVSIKPLGPLFDKRHPKSFGELTFQFTSRDTSGFLTRIYKKNALRGTELSSSGEMKIYREDPEFSFDLGTDEQIELLPGVYARLAALEAKIVCKREM